MGQNSNTIDKGVGFLRGIVSDILDIAKGDKVIAVRDLTPEERKEREADEVAKELARREAKLRSKSISHMTDDELKAYQAMLHKELNDRTKKH